MPENERKEGGGSVPAEQEADANEEDAGEDAADEQWGVRDEREAVALSGLRGGVLYGARVGAARGLASALTASGRVVSTRVRVASLRGRLVADDDGARRDGGVDAVAGVGVELPDGRVDGRLAGLDAADRDRGERDVRRAGLDVLLEVRRLQADAAAVLGYLGVGGEPERVRVPRVRDGRDGRRLDPLLIRGRTGRTVKNRSAPPSATGVVLRSRYPTPRPPLP